MSDAEGGDHPVVTGLTAAQREAATSSYFAAFRWDPPLLDPERLSVSAFFDFVFRPEPPPGPE